MWNFRRIKAEKKITSDLSLIFSIFFYHNITILEWEKNMYKSLEHIWEKLMCGPFANSNPCEVTLVTFSNCWKSAPCVFYMAQNLIMMQGTGVEIC